MRKNDIFWETNDLISFDKTIDIYWTNKFFKQTFGKKKNKFTEQTIFRTNYFTEQTILLNKLFFWPNYFTQQTILLKEQFYWTNIFTDRPIYWTNDFTERKRWKMNAFFRMNEIEFLNDWKKHDHKMGRSQTMNEWKIANVPISSCCIQTC